MCFKIVSALLTATFMMVITSCRTGDSSSELEASQRRKALDTPDKAIKLQEKLTPIVFAIDGVNGIGITSCHPKTGARDFATQEYVHCININTETDEAFNKVIKRYPPGKKVEDVFIAVEKIGKISIQPRATGGN